MERICWESKFITCSFCNVLVTLGLVKCMQHFTFTTTSCNIVGSCYQIFEGAGQLTHAISCKVQHHLTSCNMLPYIASGWPNICNTLHTTMLHWNVVCICPGIYVHITKDNNLSYVFEIHLSVIHDIVIFLDKAVKAFSWVWEWQIKANGWKKEENITSQECWFQVSRSYIGWNYRKVSSECIIAVL